MKRLLAAVACLMLLCSTGPLRIPPDEDGGAVQVNNCALFPSDNVWNAAINTLPVHGYSVQWLNTIFNTPSLGSNPGSFHVNLGGGNGHYLNVTSAAPSDSVRMGNCADGGEYNGSYPFTNGVTVLQVGDPDHHCLMLDKPNCMLFEMYGEARSAIVARDSCCYGVRWDLSTDTLRADSLSSADEAGLPITAGLFTYYELHGQGSIRHALRFQSNLANIDWHKGSWLWPARHASHPAGTYKTNLVPFGARLRLRSDFTPTGNAATDSAFLAMSQAMKDYGAILADRGTSQIALSGMADARWGAWPDTFMVWSAQWIPYLEFVDESGHMVNKNSGKFSVTSAGCGGGLSP